MAYCDIYRVSQGHSHKGTENVLITESQIAFRLHHNNGLAAEKSVRVGSSPTNSAYIKTCMHE